MSSFGKITQTRPEILAGVNILPQVKKETFQEGDIKIINGLIKLMKTNPKSTLKYLILDKDTMKLVLYSDGSIATNKDDSS